MTDKVSGKFVIVPSNAYRDRRLKANDRDVLAVLSSYATSHGECWPGLTRLAEDLGRDRPSISRSIKALEETGYLRSAPLYDNGVRTGTWYELEHDTKVSIYDLRGAHEEDELALFATPAQTDDVREIKHRPKTIARDDSARRVFERFKELFGTAMRLDARKEITERLKTYSEDELLLAMQHASESKFFMDNNSKRGAPWFFKSQERIEYYLNIGKSPEYPDMDDSSNIMARINARSKAEGIIIPWDN